MLIALIVALFLGGGSISVLDYIADTRKDVKTVVAEPDRRSAALATLKTLKKRAAALDKQTRKRARRLTKALNSHEITEAQIEEIWAAHYAAVDQFNRDMIDLRFQLKDSVTRDEWQQLFTQQ
jgi:uncharacterized protein YpuA (DUF1002 family)